MSSFVKQVSLHRIADTELQVVSDLEGDLVPFIEVEEEVIGRYAGSPRWQQKSVTLFVLRDLDPLGRQLSKEVALPSGGLGALERRPVVNVYDLKNMDACHIFVNQRAMEKEGYWGDREAVRGLLAHEHAHPLSECETTRSVRRLKVDLSTDSLRPLFPAHDQGREWQRKVDRLLALVVDKLCLYAPREVFANDVTIECGFAASLLHLDRRNVLNAAESIRSRGTLRQMLEHEMERGSFTPAGAELLLTIADMKGYLDLAMEMAPFYRQSKVAEAQEMEETLFAQVLPHLEPLVAEVYPRLRDAYVGLPQDASPAVLVSLEESMIDILAQALEGKGLRLKCRLSVIPE